MVIFINQYKRIPKLLKKNFIVAIFDRKYHGEGRESHTKTKTNHKNTQPTLSSEYFRAYVTILNA
jgi:hypothetical protein